MGTAPKWNIKIAPGPTIYLPSHDPDSEKRLVNKEVAVATTTLINDMRNMS